MIENGDFRFRDDLYKVDKGETVPIEILLPPFKGVIIRYTQVGVKEQENGTAVLRFAYEVISPGEHSELSLRRDKKFEEHLGILLNYLILEAAEAEVMENANREDYSEEPNEERTVHAESSSVSKG